MVKDIKYIIKRIIIGVVIALILMYCKGVFAMETKVTSPDGMGYQVNLNDAPGTVNMTTYSIGNATYYGYSFGNYNRTYVYWTFPKATNWDTPVDLHFNIFTGDVTSYNVIPYNVWLLSDDGSMFTCDVYSSSWKDDASSVNGTSLINTIRCENIALSNHRFKLYLGSSFTTGGNVVAISKITSFPHSNTSEITNAINNGTQATQEQTNTIKDSSIDNDKVSGDLDTLDGKTATNGTISQLLTLPIQLFQRVVNSINGSCSSFTLGTLYNHTLTMPCINLSNILGSTLYNIIDVLCCGLFVLGFRKKMVDIFEHMTSLNDRGNELE